MMRRRLYTCAFSIFSLMFLARPTLGFTLHCALRTTSTCSSISRSFSKTSASSLLPLRMTSEGENTSTVTDAQVVKDMLYRIKQCNNMPESAKTAMMDFSIDSQTVGKVTEKVAGLLCQSHTGMEPVFEIITTESQSRVLTLSKSARFTKESRTNSVKGVMDNLRSSGIITGWRDELYGLSSGFYEEPILLIERAAASFLGMLHYGVHINGIVSTEGRMWMARRSETKSKYPGYLDQMVAGGQPAGLSLMENVVKECMEEAGIPNDMTEKGIKAVGAISYEEFVPSDHQLIDGVIERVVLFNYDLDLPADFNPVPVDGEVQYFFKWSVEDIVNSMAKDYHDPIKPNCYICIIDYLLRNGVISPDTPGYLNVVRELRSGSCA